MKSPFPFFKHAQIYSLSRDITPDTFAILKLHDTMITMPFTPCGEHDAARTGWLMTESEDGEMPDIMHRTGDVLITMVREVRQIPAAAFKDELNARLAKFESRLLRKPKAAERGAIKDEVFQAMLPRAFPSRKHTQIWIDLESKRIVVDASSPKEAENALALLRKTLGSLPVVPLTLENPIELTMTDWLKQAEFPQGIALSEKHNEAQFTAILEGGGKVAYRKAEILSEATTCLLDAGQLLTSLGVRVNERVDLVVNDSAQLKKLVFADELTEQNSDIDMEDVQARRYADFTLMADELRNTINLVILALGGEARR